MRKSKGYGILILLHKKVGPFFGRKNKRKNKQEGFEAGTANFACFGDCSWWNRLDAVFACQGV
jgi:hypothetical protein